MFPLCQLLPWDSEFFQCRIARVCGETLNEVQARQMEDWSREEQVRCLYFLARANDPITIQTAEQHGFRLVDIRLTFDWATGSSPAPAPPVPPAGIRIRPAQAADLAGLQAIARLVHGDTRFFKDSHFPRQRAEELYALWITKDVEGRAQVVLVAVSEADEPLGYITVNLDPSRQQGQIGLVGVSPQARRWGIGKSLVLAAMDWFRTQGVPEVAVVTQGDNRAAQRLYQQCGFLTRDLQLWYHKWYAGSA